jgi:hypothetical protein
MSERQLPQVAMSGGISAVSFSAERLVRIERDLNCLGSILDVIMEDIEEFGGSPDFTSDMKELILRVEAFSSISAPS